MPCLIKLVSNLMVTMNLGAKVSGNRHCPRINTIELKLHIERTLGRQKSDQYFNFLNRYLSRKLSKSEFDKVCLGLLGRENIFLHNRLIRAIIKNACFANSPPPNLGKTKASSKSNLHFLCKDVLPQSPRKGRRTPNLRDRKSRDQPSPLGPHWKPPQIQEQQSPTELLSLGSRPPTSVEEGEEVEQSPGIHSRKNPLRAPFGVSFNAKGMKKELFYGPSQFNDVGTCYSNCELPGTDSLRARLEQKMSLEGLYVSTDCVSLLNNGLDVFVKRLLKPYLDLAASKPNRSFSVSMTDLRVAVESNPRILGHDWIRRIYG